MRVLIAFDKFKDSLSAFQAGEVAAQALREAQPDWEIEVCPLSDGGEGFAEILSRSAKGTRQRTEVCGPRDELVSAQIEYVSTQRIPQEALGFLGPEIIHGKHHRLALIELAAASGLALIEPSKRDPWLTSTFGTGQLLKGVADAEVDAIILGLGGSATHDLGTGALSALGVNFLMDTQERVSVPTPQTWPLISQLESKSSQKLPPLFLACDVENPLLGPRGAAAVYATQKGLLAKDFTRLEAQTERMANLLCAHFGESRDKVNFPGAGAAGGAAFGLMIATQAKIISGFALVDAWLKLEKRLGWADILITGEGRFDDSSLSGKGPGMIARRARMLGKSVHIFAGQWACEKTLDGLTGHTITPETMPLAPALAQAPELLAQAIRTAFRSP